MSAFTVENLYDLIMGYNVTYRIYCDGHTFEFTDGDMPDEIKYLEVDSIDNPLANPGQPITFNIAHRNFDNYAEFCEMYADEEV